ncbi:btk-binding protein-related [Anaeramoeba flamelloides]|uniref:Btk-binding protein-related n=1 Tax=Anaeramoeba flamelloides TaxID=1746091 RepID=A0AAV7Z808_9EUKA|nr:btk-binding protein-related [Anaeramoeba flamelloides]
MFSKNLLSQSDEDEQNEPEKSDVYFSGQTKSYSLLFSRSIDIKNRFVPITKIKRPKKIVIGNSQHTLVLYPNNKLELYHEKLGIQKFEIQNEQIKDIVASAQNYQIVTRSGNLYSLASGKDCSYQLKIPITDFTRSTFKEIRQVTFFKEKNLSIDKIAMGYCTNYYLCTDGQFFTSGYSDEGRLGLGQKDNTTHQLKPVKIFQDVERIFSGIHGLSCFFITNSNQLYAFGNNSHGKLGIGNGHIQYKPQMVKTEQFQADDIEHLITAQYHSILITKDGRTFSSGSPIYNGIEIKKEIFTQIPTLQDKFIIRIATGEYRQLALSQEGELFCWGFTNCSTPSTTYKKNIKTPQIIQLPNLNNMSPNSIQISCGSRSTFIYNNVGNTLSLDFEHFFKNGKFTDCVLGTKENEIKCHKLLIELRTNNTKLEQINKLIEEKCYSKEQLQNFLKWIYYEEINNATQLEEIFTSLNLSPLHKENEHSLKNDLLRLYKEEDSKDFSLLVQIQDEDEDEDNDDDDDDDDEDEPEEIPVHKIVLLARSGLFREMFKNIDQKEETNSVKDYSGKSIETLEILIKYFYTEKIELTADDDPQLILEELEDAQEYYQLNENCNLNHELDRIKKQLLKN